MPDPSPRRGGAQAIPRPSANRPGPPLPWTGLPEARRQLTLESVRAALARTSPTRLPPAQGTGTRLAAVLAPLYEADGQVWVVLTRRAQHLRSHRGEVSFPGGAREGDEDLETTALREAQEEIGLDPASVEVVGELDHLRTFMARSSITPFVGFLPGRPELEANPAEVERILHVPLAELLADGVCREERWGVPPLDHAMYFFEVVGDTVWGATARMLVDLLTLATGTELPPPRPVQLAPPDGSAEREG